MTVVITGASSGIGRAVALELHNRNLQLVLSGRNSDRLAEVSKSCGNAATVLGDLSSSDNADKLFSRLPDGPICAVFAAGTADFGPTTEFTDIQWNDAISSNLTGLFNCCRAAVNTMLQRGGGKIINVLSIASTHPFPQSAAYVASKAGALGLTRSLQAEYRSQGIAITAFIPGSTATELWDRQAWSPDQKDMIRPEDVAGAIADILLAGGTGYYDEVVFMPKKGIL
jgi:short-subunit dehydrogenase